MAKFKITPKQASSDHPNKLSFSVTSIDNKYGVRLHFDNATNETTADIDGYGEYIEIPKNVKECHGLLDLKIPEHSSHSVVSVFANIEKQKKDGTWELADICPYMVEIALPEGDISSCEVSVEPNFLSRHEKGKILVKGKENSKFAVSINDRRQIIMTDSEGNGSLSFRAEDMLSGGSVPVLQKFPIYIYDTDDNFTKRQFTGSFVHILPVGVETLASTDPRCDDPCWPYHLQPYAPCPGDPWQVPPDICEPGQQSSLSSTPSEPRQPDPEIPTVSTSCSSDVYPESGISTCRVHKKDVTNLSNGTVLVGFTAIDKAATSSSSSQYNKSRVFVVQSSTSLNQNGDLPYTVISHGNVHMPPKTTSTDSFVVYVEKEIWDVLTEKDLTNNNVWIALFDDSLSYASWKVVETRDINEYDPYYSIRLETTSEKNPSFSNWKYCVHSIIYEFTTPIIIGTISLPMVSDAGGDIYSPMNIAIATNDYSVENEQVVYVVVDASIGGKPQLWFYSFTIDINSGTIYSDTSSDKTFGWRRLTYTGANKNPKMQVDEAGTIHVVWESDRSGSTQLYYGCLGPGERSFCNSAISSVIDKQAALLASGDDLVVPYVTQNIINVTEPSVESPYFSGYVWDSRIKGNGNITYQSDQRLTVSGNPIDDCAVALYHFDSDYETRSFDGRQKQINYQISFNLTSSSLESLDSTEVDSRYDDWLSKFTVGVYGLFSNMPVYRYNGNKFVVGRQDEVYDRFIPIVGAYRDEVDSEGHLQAIVSGTDANVRHFFIALMPEVSKFNATNIETKSEYCDELGILLSDTAANNYLAEDDSTVYTGNVKLAIVMSADNEYYSKSDRNDYFGKPGGGNIGIVRQISDAIDINFTKNIKVGVNYTKLYNQDIRRLLGKVLSPTRSMFMCSLTVLIDDSQVFAESFFVDMADGYDAFDIGLGFPSLGSYVTQDFWPYETNVYNDLSLSLQYSDINISSPSMSFNEEIIIVPKNIRDMDNIVVDFGSSNRTYGGIWDYPESSQQLGLLPESETSIEDFPQIPITLLGINQSPSIAKGECNDLHLSWQSNRDMFWNIFTSNSMDRNLIFRHDTAITNTESNSLSPSISANRSGGRLVAWHDDRGGEYEIYVARATSGYSCALSKCSDTVISNVINTVVGQEKIVKFSFTNNTGLDGYFNFALQLFQDNNYTSLAKTISSLEDIYGWTAGGINFVSSGAFVSAGANITITYTPKESDGMYGRIWYIIVTTN